MKNILIISYLAIFGNFNYCLGQEQEPHEFTDSTRLHIYKALRNQEIIFRCDTTYIMNKYTYGNFKNIRNGYILQKDAARTYDTIMSLQKRRITEQNTEYQRLRTSYDSLSLYSVNFIADTKNRLKSVNDTITDISKNLTLAKASIDQANQMLSKEISRTKWTKFLYGTGGLVVGVGLSAFIIGIAGH